MSDGTGVGNVKVMDLSIYEERSAAVHEPEISVRGRSKSGTWSTQAMDLFTDSCKAHNLASQRPASLVIGEAEDNEQIVYARPSMKRSPKNLGLTWSEDGQTLRVQIGKLLKARNITIPPKSRMVIRVSLDQKVPNFGVALVFHLGEAEFVAIEEGVRKKQQEQAAKPQVSKPQAGKEPA